MPGDNAGVEGYRTGTLGVHGSYFKAFGRSGTAAILHGQEAVVTPKQAPDFARRVLARTSGSGSAGISSGAGQASSETLMLLAAIRSLPRDIKLAIREGLAMA